MRQLLIVSLLTLHIYSFELYLGISDSYSDFVVYDQVYVQEPLASFEILYDYTPFIAISSKSRYFFKDYGLGYKVDFGVKKLNLKSQMNREDKRYYVSLFSSYLVPTLFYEFNKNGNLRFKIGIGQGLSWVLAKGRFIVTNKKVTTYNNEYNIDINYSGFAHGEYIELSYIDHFLIYKDFGPDLSDDNFNYYQSNSSLIYQYRFIF